MKTKEMNIEVANNKFAYKMARQLFTEKENMFFSPYSIFSAFAQVYIGARKDTERQFQDALDYGPQDIFHNSMNESMGRLENFKENIFNIANSLWAKSKDEFYTDFLTLLKELYDSEINEVSFSEIVSKVNQWVSEKTNKKITEIISEGDISDKLLFILVNAVYFKGKWEKEFEKKDTKKRPFYTEEGEKKVDTMFMEEGFQYFEDEKYQFLSIPYKHHEVYMDILLPKKEYYLSSIDVGDFEKLEKKCYHRENIEIYLPKFKMEYGFFLNNFLENMGLRKAFNPAEADFSGIADISQPIYISSAVHKAFVEVDEEGTEAAAATAVMMVRGCVVNTPPEKIIFRADHPFYFQIKSNTGEVLFLGKVEDPSC